MKVRTGPARDEPEDYRALVWAGVLPVRVVFGVPEADAALPPGTPVPAHVRERAWQAVGQPAAAVKDHR